MTDANQKTPDDVLRHLAAVLDDDECDSDDLIHAFGDVEAMRKEVSRLLLALLDATEE